MTTSASTYTLGGMNTIEVRELVHFTTVADALHFGAAAERLGISQPSLSRSIARLERRLGFPLFHRTTRRISLTPAGEVFLADCRRLLAEMDGAIRRAQRAGKSGSLKLAVRPGAGQGVLTGLLDSYAELPGSGPVEVLYCYDEVSALHAGAADVALMCATSTTHGSAGTAGTGRRTTRGRAPRRPPPRRPVIAGNGRPAEPAGVQRRTAE